MHDRETNSYEWIIKRVASYLSLSVTKIPTCPLRGSPTVVGTFIHQNIEVSLPRVRVWVTYMTCTYYWNNFAFHVRKVSIELTRPTALRIPVWVALFFYQLFGMERGCCSPKVEYMVYIINRLLFRRFKVFPETKNNSQFYILKLFFLSYDNRFPCRFTRLLHISPQNCCFLFKMRKHTRRFCRICAFFCLVSIELGRGQNYYF